ncbi:MAG: hypothetical protein RPU64_13280 [Candidatus Sedimenticola sp. (ex Thyasira tokunagai)]
MNNLTISDLKPGMVIAEGVFDTSGRILLEANTSITPDVVRTLRSWGIASVSIIPMEGVMQPVPESPADTPHSEILRAALEQRFSLTKRDHPAIQAIFSTCFEYALRRSSNE